MVPSSFICKCKKYSVWIYEGKVSEPCPNCGRTYNYRKSIIVAKECNRMTNMLIKFLRRLYKSDAVTIIAFVMLVSIAGCEDQYSSGFIKSSDRTKDIYKECVEGHVYYRLVGTKESSLAIKLDDDGKPVKCE